ncbi:MAG: Fic family protein [Gammaproteobacteria bacterium]|nr:Fic family protein [Gammaproteobacteria bacterium]
MQGVPPQRITAILEARELLGAAGTRYLHWEELKRRTPPAGFTREEWWLGLKFSRFAVLRDLPLKDVDGRAFYYATTDTVQELLHQLDQRAAGTMGFPDALTNPESRDRYLVSSLMEEAITSSQLEGASTTRQVAAQMLRTGRAPGDHSEQMIYNNYKAMQFARSMQDRPLTAADVLDLHRITTGKTLDDPASAGRLQMPDETRVTVVDRGTGEILFTPPPAAQLPARLAAMVRFANGEIPANRFIHPVIRAVMLHFWLAYDHPFEDGNGRTARALFYWAMLRSRYWLFEYVSISTILRKAVAQYGRSYLYAESDENDATYFLLHQLEVMLQGIHNLDEYLKRKAAEIKGVEKRLRNAQAYNHRQLALLSHALRHANAEYTVKSHQRSHDVAYATARADLLALVTAGLLISRRGGGKAMVFRVPEDLEKRLEKAGARVSRRKLG